MHLGLLIYGSLDTLSGGYLYDRLLVEALQQRGEKVTLLSLPWRNYLAHLSDNFHVRLPVGLDLLIQDELNHPSLIIANRLARPHPYPVISLVHHLRCSEPRPAWQNAFYRWIERAYLRSVDAFIFNSHTTRRAVQQILGQLPPYRVAFPPTDRFGVALEETAILARAREAEFRLLFIGNLIPRKGLHTLLDALALHPFGNRPYRLDVVGSLSMDPAYSRAQQQRVRRLGLADRVYFHGALHEAELRHLLEQAHLLVVPSAYEGFGIVYLEGMGFGLPAIGTTAGAASEVIEPDQTGYLIPPEDSATLADHLRGLASDRERLIRLSLQARQRYLRQPRWEETVAIIHAFLYECLNRFRPISPP